MTGIQTLITKSKTPQHELIVEMLDYYGVAGVRDLTEAQIEEYAEGKEEWNT